MRLFINRYRVIWLSLFILAQMLFTMNGCRKKESIHEMPKYDGTIVAAGDSLTAGLYLLENEAYPAQLEMRLLREGHRYSDLDILVITEGRISIGEVKSDPKGFKEEHFTKLRTIASELRPDELVVAAVGTAWPPHVNEQIISLSQDLAKVDVVVTPLLLQWFKD